MRPADATATHCLLLHLNPDWFCLLVPAHLGGPGRRAVKRMCVCVRALVYVNVNVEFKVTLHEQVHCRGTLQY